MTRQRLEASPISIGVSQHDTDVISGVVMNFSNVKVLFTFVCKGMRSKLEKIVQAPKRKEICRTAPLRLKTVVDARLGDH